MNKIWSIVSVGIRQMLADPMFVIFTLGLPILMTWAMSFLPREAGVYEIASLGVLVMFIALSLMTSAAVIIEEKEKGTWQRLMTTPTSYWQIMMGHFIKLFIVAWIQTIILLLSGKYLFGAPWEKGYFSMVIVLTVYIISMTGLGLFLAGFLKSQKQVQAVATGIVIIGTMLGNVFFPIENATGIIKIIGKISPQSWAAHALKDILTTGADITNLITPIIWMLSIGFILLAIGVLRIKYANNNI